MRLAVDKNGLPGTVKDVYVVWMSGHDVDVAVTILAELRVVQLDVSTWRPESQSLNCERVESPLLTQAIAHESPFGRCCVI